MLSWMQNAGAKRSGWSGASQHWAQQGRIRHILQCCEMTSVDTWAGQERKKEASAQSTHLIARVFHLFHLFQFYEWRFFTLKLGNLARQQHIQHFQSQTCCLQIEISKKTAQALIACAWDYSASTELPQYDFSRPHFCNHNCCQLERKSSNKVKFEQRQEEEKEVGFGMFCRYGEKKDPAVNVMNIQNPVIYCSCSNTSFITKIMCRKSYSQKVISRVETIALQHAKDCQNRQTNRGEVEKGEGCPSMLYSASFPGFWLFCSLFCLVGTIQHQQPQQSAGPAPLWEAPVEPRETSLIWSPFGCGSIGSRKLMLVWGKSVSLEQKLSWSRVCKFD